MKRAAWFVLCLSVPACGQTPLERTVPVQPGEKLLLDFDHPSLQLKTWDKREVLIRGTVTINRGENDGAFELKVDRSEGVLTITSSLVDEKSIPPRVMIMKDGQEYYFKASRFDDPVVQEFLKTNGRNYGYTSIGVVREINLEVFVPRQMETAIRAKYGLVEVIEFEAPLRINAGHGKVDVTINASAVGQIVARTRHGEILTNLDVKFDQAPFSARKRDHWTEISASPGKGPQYSIEAKHGDVYLRKP